eukprot:1160477-Pelagomonas_calceolata.AAC.7
MPEQSKFQLALLASRLVLVEGAFALKVRPCARRVLAVLRGGVLEATRPVVHRCHQHHSHLCKGPSLVHKTAEPASSLEHVAACTKNMQIHGNFVCQEKRRTVHRPKPAACVAAEKFAPCLCKRGD